MLGFVKLLKTCTALKKVQLSDGLKQIENQVIANCNFTKFRIPPLVTSVRWLKEDVEKSVPPMEETLTKLS